MVSTVAFIFARDGSKGLPNKNILNFCGKPLIAWSIEQSLSVPRIDRVIVSTDSEAIAKIALDYGAEVPFIRPAELASDTASEILSWKHGLHFLKESTGSYPDVFVSVPPTAPLRFSSDIELCLDEFSNGKSDIVITVTDAHRNPYFNMVSADADGHCALVMTMEIETTRRQDAKSVFDMTTVCYVADPNFILNSDSIFNGKVRSIHVPPERAIDIDSLLDFQIAEFIHVKRGENNERS